jgi:predicted DNA-binding protein
MRLTNLSDWAATVRLNRGPLKTVSVRLGPELLEQLEQIDERLSHPGRAALLRYLLAEGIKSTAARLDQAEAAEA